MGSPVSPIVANLYMEHLEREVLRSALTPPRHWFRYMDDTLSFNNRLTNKYFWII